MGRASQIVEACAELIESVKAEGATGATMLIELDREFDGWCFEITFRRVEPEDCERTAADNRGGEDGKA